MSRIRFALCSLPILLASVSAADVSGSWRMSFKADWTSIPDLACTLSQKDDKLSGSCRNAGGRDDGQSVELNDGSINGEQVSWTWKVTVPDGVTWTYSFAGTLDGSGTAMKGVVTLSAGPGAKPNGASFTAKKE
jgi:hypothetical protein